jgi:fatty acid/phospholipid biosynthesis enzyme
LIIKAHGRSKAKAIKNAVLFAEKSVQSELVRHIEETMKEFYLHMFNNGESNQHKEA